MAKGYKYILYETDGDRITTVTFNRPERMNVFNREMCAELTLALVRFAHADEEKVLILTGAGRAFSTGEDLSNINLDANYDEMCEYAKTALRDYHSIVQWILGVQKPVVALLNGVAAGAGLSIALACDYRFVVGDSDDLRGNRSIFVPAFADMGLIADSGMTATLPRLVGKHEAQKWCELPRYGVSIGKGVALGVVDDPTTLDVIAKGSSVAYAFSKDARNNALLYKLNKRVFPWELRAQTACLQSYYFKEKARAFLEKQKARPASAQEGSGEAREAK